VSNEAYLIFAYFLALLGSVLLAVYVYYSLHETFAELASDLLSSKSARWLRKMFSSSIWLIALLGFSTVSMTNSCVRITEYSEVIVDKVYVYDRAREQISASAMQLFWGLALWGLVVSILVIARKRQGTSTHD
jgi:hypothetical protein